KEPLTGRVTKGDPPRFADRVIGVRARNSQGIGECGTRFLEGDLVFLEIRSSLARIPCYTHSLILLRGRGALVLRLPAPRRRGRLGGARADGASPGAARGAEEAPGRERAAPLRHRARAGGHRARRRVRAREAALVVACREGHA